jgi:hypothetical protein
MSLEEIHRRLKEPFDPRAIHWRVGATSKAKDKGLALAYLDARDVMDRLDSVVGFESWQDEYDETKTGRIVCKISVDVHSSGGDPFNWVSKSDGAGDTAVEGEKGAMSDAFKRAAVKWGIGRYLYRLDSLWAPIDQYKKITQVPKLPDWALPGPRTTLAEHTAAVRDNWESIVVVKGALSDGPVSLSEGAEAWFELDDKAKEKLWISTRDGGIWTPEERKFIKEELRSHLA